MAQAVSTGTTGGKPAKAVSATGKPDFRGMALALGGGALLILAVIPFLPKQEIPTVAPAARPTPNVSTSAGGGGGGSITPHGGLVPVGAAGAASGIPQDGGDASGGNAAPGTVNAAVTGGEPVVRVAGIRELFNPLVAVQAPPVKNVKGPTPPPTPLPSANTTPPAPTTAPPPTTPTPPPGPSAKDLQMLGVIEMGTDVKALLKKTATGESRYVAKGEEAFGFKLDEIKADEVTLSREGKSEVLKMSDEIVIETPGGGITASGGPSTGSGGGSRFGGGNSFGGGNRFGGDRNGGNRFGGGGNDRNSNRSDRNGGGSGNQGGFSTSDIMSLPTWSARLKKLEEVKGQMPAEQYQRLKTFMEARAKSDTSK